MPEDPQPVRFYKKSDVTRIEATVPAALSADPSRNPVLMARHSAGFSTAMALVMAGRALLADKVSSDIDAFSALMVLLFWAMFWSVLFACGLAWARVQRLPSFWWPFVAGAVTSVGFYALNALLSHWYGVAATTGEGPVPRSYVAAWMVGYSFIAPALAGMITAFAWRAWQGRAGQAAPPAIDRGGSG
jgi:hypothetical protein